MVERLNFSIPEFLRIIWVSEEAQSIWEPRIHCVSLAYQKLEIDAAQIGLKTAAMQSCSPDGLPSLIRYCLKNGLQVIPLAQEGTINSYANATIPFDAGLPWQYRVVIAQPGIAEEFANAWQERNDILIGKLLGFPLCCREFYHRNWNELGLRDLTFPMVEREDERFHYIVEGPVSCNMLLRWLGVRLVSHLPCAFDCKETEQIGNAMLMLMEKLYPREARWLREMLDWSVRWDSMHGVAIITTPVVRIVTSTDAFASKIIIDRPGRLYPEAGASGLEFPFQQVKVIRVSTKDTWTDNGFSSKSAMDEAHKMILESLPDDFETILDLGCGNGVLLEKIINHFNAVGFGIEANDERAKKAMIRIGSTILHGLVTDFATLDAKFDIILVARQRLNENIGLEEQLNLVCDKVLVYDYSTNECYFARDEKRRPAEN